MGKLGFSIAIARLGVEGLDIDVLPYTDSRFTIPIWILAFRMTPILGDGSNFVLNNIIL